MNWELALNSLSLLKFNTISMTEFGLIDHIKEKFANLPHYDFEGIGDDCSVLPLGDEALVFTSDMLVEDVHFLRDGISPFDLGYKSLAVNLSDVAAMGVRPVATLLSIAIPKELTGEYIEEFIAGYHSLSSKYNVALVGGDTTASKGAFSINITAIGRGPIANIKRRSDAKVGDLIVVNGSLGESGAGLKDILEGRVATELAKIHCRPEPQVAQGEWLGARKEVHAMMDISDGIASDVRHIMSCSSVGARIDIDAVPTSVERSLALTAGEDYKLLFTVDAEQWKGLDDDYFAKFGQRLHIIGRIDEGDSLRWYSDGAEQNVDHMGFRHY